MCNQSFLGACTVEVYTSEKGQFVAGFMQGMALKLFAQALRKPCEIVACGELHFQGDYSRLFQEYEHGEGWTGYGVLWLVLRVRTGFEMYALLDKGCDVKVLGRWDFTSAFGALATVNCLPTPIAPMMIYDKSSMFEALGQILITTLQVYRDSIESHFDVTSWQAYLATWEVSV